MKLNIASPQNGTNICITVSGSTERLLYNKSLGDVIDAGLINPEYTGWKMMLTGGSDKQGFPMDPEINTDKRQRLLRKKGNIGFRPKRKGELRRKSVRGAVVSEEVSVLCVKIVNNLFTEKEEGKTTLEPKHIEGLTDKITDKTHLPKRFNKLKAALGLSDIEITPKEVKDAIINAIPAPKEGEKKKIPKIKMTRIRGPRFLQRLRKKQKISQLRKEKTERERAEFLQKYPEWLKS